MDLHGLLGVDVDVLHECARFVLADRDGGEAEGAVALENMVGAEQTYLKSDILDLKHSLVEFSYIATTQHILFLISNPVFEH